MYIHTYTIRIKPRYCLPSYQLTLIDTYLPTNTSRYLSLSNIHMYICIQTHVNNLHLPTYLHSYIHAYIPTYQSTYLPTSDWRPGGRGFNPRRGRQHSFVEIDHEIFSTVILSLPLIQEGQLSVSGKRMCTILVNRLED